MSRKVQKIKEELPGINMTAMIDIVFQLIIFFIFTIKMQEDVIDRTINLSNAPHGTAVGPPKIGSITVNVRENGDLAIKRTVISPELFHTIAARLVAEKGPANVPVTIVGDGRTQHRYIKKAMDACSSAGVSRLKFLALKERGR